MTRVGVLDAARAFWWTVRSRRASRDEIVAFQEARLRRLIEHAHRNVPYYRSLFERHGVEPGRVKTVADLALLPVTSRRDLQAAPPPSRLARGVDPARLVTHRTSGSTGEPLHVRRTWLEERITTVFRLRALRDLGVRPGDTRVGFVLPRRPDPRNWNGPQRLMRALGIYRKVMLDRRPPPGELLRQLVALRPDVISGTPGTLFRLATALREDRSVSVRPRLLMCGGDVLTPPVRRAIAESFGASVYSMYGSYELGLIAWECPRSGALHVADDGVALEIVKDGRPAEPGEEGEVVATQLHAFAAPFIRYRLGDRVTRGETPCRCGAPFSTILDVRGRVQDYLPLANGRLFMSTEIVPFILDHPHPWVAQHQLIQERADRIVLQIVPLVPPPPGAILALERAVQERLGPGIELDVKVVPEIPLEGDGKFQVARSLVSSIYDANDADRPGIAPRDSLTGRASGAEVTHRARS